MHLAEVIASLSNCHRVVRFCPMHWPWQLARSRVDRLALDLQLRTFARTCDVLFFEWAEYEFVRATHILRNRNIVVRLHSHELWDYAPQVHWPAVSHVILVSHAMERKLLERFPELIGRTSVVHNGVRVDRFTPSTHAFGGVVGTLSRIDPYKRLYDLVLALYELKHQGYDFRLRIGGSPTENRYLRYASELEILIRRLDLTDHVEFTGFVDDVPKWLTGIDLFVSHSCAEGLQVALIEAMASGVYCLSHRWDGADEVLPSDNLYWTDRELQFALKAYSNTSEEDRASKGTSLRALAEKHFNGVTQAEKIRRIIEDVATDAPLPPTSVS